MTWIWPPAPQSKSTQPDGKVDPTAVFRLGARALERAAALTPGLLTSEEKASLISSLEAKQLADGGWSSATLVIRSWKRRDGTPLDTNSDGYATGLVSFALEQAGIAPTQPPLSSGLAWLARNQEKGGFWPASSLNKQRDPQSDAGRFMTDAATAYSVLALTGVR
jgi:squalene-hopene/tetraprenyl-beta-curcumene cyclase